ncbi:Methyltransferase domain-containing protein [Actinopolyspora lacussalsi subsp. righensis]|uniref:Methyltransferase domain-containing protein n=1 Tax=Actinopolyspora righensis TaxID=995060 RepID=A0A1I6XCV3_9ACTN|nr:class I SAM-dependent methyltransferase [Actinopolyspora righensis]SFT36110.1 Methyltransferase domain-containing protein [Actinopolyspora righensis]
MFDDETSKQSFGAAVQRLWVPGMGTEVVAPLLSNLIHMVRPTRVLEVGMGYTTPFLAKALAEVEEQVEAERAALVDKTESYLREGRDLDEEWIDTPPALLVPGFYNERRNVRFVAVDDLSDGGSSAGEVTEVLDELGLSEQVTVVNGQLRDCREVLPDGFAPIDFAWVDAWECLYFFENFWDLINPNGGLVVMHYLMTYPEGEAILEYLADSQRLRAGEFELLSLLESQKLRQNSLTVIRKTAEVKSPQYSEAGQVPRLGGAFREAATSLADDIRGAS